MPKQIQLKKILMLIILLSIIAYILMILIAKLELGGASPNEQVFGELVDLYQADEQPFCTGVYVTPQSTWLVGRKEGSSIEDFEFAKAAPNLAKLVYNSENEADKTNDSANWYGLGYGFSNRSDVSFVSKLDKKGVFQLVAVVPEKVCLQATPDGSRVFLLTGLNRPRSNTESTLQNVIFQSDDQGKTWQWRKEGLFPKNAQWDLEPYFYNTQSVWAWGDSRSEEYRANVTVLQYSPDGGTTIEDIALNEPLIKFSGNDNTSQHVVQLTSDTALLSVSQRGENDSNLMREYNSDTSTALLTRKQGAWQVGMAKEAKGMFIEKVIDNHAGKIVALLNDDGNQRIALLNKKTDEWEVQGDVPSAFGFLPAQNRNDGIYVGNNSIVVNVDSDHKVPRWLYPWGRYAASVSASAVFYSTDWGKSWRKLNIDGYFGALGVDAKRNKVIWKRNWHDEKYVVWSYDLK